MSHCSCPHGLCLRVSLWGLSVGKLLVVTCTAAFKCQCVCVCSWVTRLGKSVGMTLFLLLNAETKMCTDFLYLCGVPFRALLFSAFCSLCGILNHITGLACVLPLYWDLTQALLNVKDTSYVGVLSCEQTC